MDEDGNESAVAADIRAALVMIADTKDELVEALKQLPMPGVAQLKNIDCELGHLRQAIEGRQQWVSWWKLAVLFPLVFLAGAACAYYGSQWIGGSTARQVQLMGQVDGLLRTQCGGCPTVFKQAIDKAYQERGFASPWKPH